MPNPNEPLREKVEAIIEGVLLNGEMPEIGSKTDFYKSGQNSPLLDPNSIRRHLATTIANRVSQLIADDKRASDKRIKELTLTVAAERAKAEQLRLLLKENEGNFRLAEEGFRVSLKIMKEHYHEEALRLLGRLEKDAPRKEDAKIGIDGKPVQVYLNTRPISVVALVNHRTELNTPKNGEPS